MCFFKVFNLHDGSGLFTLHGHCGPITTALLAPAFEENSIVGGVAVDLRSIGAIIASGAQDGSLCVWDLQTGACVYRLVYSYTETLMYYFTYILDIFLLIWIVSSVQAHNGNVAAITFTSSYIVSLGSDEKLCVWERFQGHLLNTVQMVCYLFII